MLIPKSSSDNFYDDLDDNLNDNVNDVILRTWNRLTGSKISQNAERLSSDHLSPIGVRRRRLLDSDSSSFTSSSSSSSITNNFVEAVQSSTSEATVHLGRGDANIIDSNSDHNNINGMDLSSRNSSFVGVGSGADSVGGGNRNYGDVNVNTHHRNILSFAASYFNDSFRPQEVNLFATNKSDFDSVIFSTNRNDSAFFSTNLSETTTNSFLDEAGGGRAGDAAALVFMALALFIIIFASVCGNLLVIFAVYKNLRLRSKTNVSMCLYMCLRLCVRARETLRLGNWVVIFPPFPYFPSFSISLCSTCRFFLVSVTQPVFIPTIPSPIFNSVSSSLPFPSSSSSCL